MKSKTPRMLIDELMGQLQTESAEVRASAARDLGLWGSPEALSPLIQALNDPEPSVRCMVVCSLRELGDKRAIGPLMEKLDDPDDDVVASAILALSVLGGTNLPPRLTAFLEYPHKAIQIQSIRSLRMLRYEPAAVQLRRLLRDPDPEIRDEALNALIYLRGGFRRGAGFGLSEEELGELESLLNDPDGAVRESAWGAAELAYPSLLQGHKRVPERLPKPDGRPPSADELLSGLRSPDWIDRSTAARELGIQGDARAAEPLIQALGDARRQVRSAAAHSLGRLGRDHVSTAFLDQAVERLVVLLEDRNENVIASAVFALGQLGDSLVAAKLLPFLDYPQRTGEVRMRSVAIEALATLHYAPAIPRIQQLLSDPDAVTRNDALSALLGLRHEFDIDVEEILKLFLDDPSQALRERAEIMLKVIACESRPQ